MKLLFSFILSLIVSSLVFAQVPEYNGPTPQGLPTIEQRFGVPGDNEAPIYRFSGLIYNDVDNGVFGFGETLGSFVRLSITEQPLQNDWLIINQYNYGPEEFTWDRLWRSTIYPVPERVTNLAVNGGVSREWDMNFTGFTWVDVSRSQSAAGTMFTIQDSTASIDAVANGVRFRYTLNFNNLVRNPFGLPLWIGDPYALAIIPDGTAAVVLYNTIVQEDGGKLSNNHYIRPPTWIQGSFGDDPLHKSTSFLIIPLDAGNVVSTSDVDGDSVTTINDYFTFINNYFSGDLSSDFNGDEQLTPADFFEFVGYFVTEYNM